MLGKYLWDDNAPRFLRQSETLVLSKAKGISALSEQVW